MLEFIEVAALAYAMDYIMEKTPVGEIMDSAAEAIIAVAKTPIDILKFYESRM